ncbi:uncharacterized protein LOC105693574 [Athalia rosae]|uniref:uncharacterized protein LOC105693574 n=1 Tax=Athalia rosae TaxID=37344 RepID=UPI000626BF00|nr:uncharacterized protein LOC105693574 [Athalia rosae]
MADDPVTDHHQESREKTSVEVIPLLIKIVEVVLAIFAIGLVVDPFNSFQKIYNKPQTKLDDIAIVYVTIAGYILINMVIIIGYVMGDRMPKKTALLFSSVGAILFIVAGSVIVHDWRKLRGSYVQISNNAIYPSKQFMEMLISGGVFAFVDAAVFVVDVFITFQYS